jgi:glucokinase
MSAPRHILALDFGGTKLAAAVVNVATGDVLCPVRTATPAAAGATACLDAMVAIARESLRRQPDVAVTGIGVSFGGPVSRDRRTVLRSMHVPAWDGFDLPARLSATFGLPAFMDNDGNAAALGEWRFGAGQGTRDMLYVQVSTGIGAGIITDGRVYRGGGLAAEFGHLTVLPDGPACTCGKAGCVEALAAGWAIARAGRAAFGDAMMDAEQVVAAAAAGDPRAQTILDRAFTHLALGIANAVILLDPEVVVLGGGLARAEAALRRVVEPALARFLPPIFRDRARLAFSRLAGAETLVGAALLVEEQTLSC